MILNLGLCHQQAFLTFDEYVSNAHYIAGAVFKFSQKSKSLNSFKLLRLLICHVLNFCAVFDPTPEHLSFHTCACRALDPGPSSFPSSASQSSSPSKSSSDPLASYPLTWPRPRVSLPLPLTVTQTTQVLASAPRPATTDDPMQNADSLFLILQWLRQPSPTSVPRGLLSS